ncbi:MAG: RNA polymerase sigma factor [Streptosporangiaceae bacterium]
MQDRELVAAITAGDADGLAEAYDRYALPLYTYCRFMLPDPDPMGSAAQAVQDTFIIAAAKLPGLTDPDRLRPWLHLVVRNECMRRLGPDSAAPATPFAGSPAPEGALPEVTLPDALKNKVLEACADSSPIGRAYRASVIHRAGPFGRNGFPRPAVPSGPRWWHDLRRRPRAAAAVAAVAGATVLGGIVAAAMLGGQHQAPISPVALGGGVPISGVAADPAGGPSSPVRKPAPTTTAAMVPVPVVTHSLTQSKATPSGRPAASTPASPSGSPSPSPSGSPSSSIPPRPGQLKVSPTSLALAAAPGKVARGTIILKAVGGPVIGWSITVPAGVAAKVTLSQYSGSLASGTRVVITVSVKSKVAVNTDLTVNPGRTHVTVVLSISA